MKFYLEIDSHFNAQRRAPIVNDDPSQARKCFCSAQLNPEQWRLGEQLSEEAHLYK